MDFAPDVVANLVRLCSELAREKMWARIHLIPVLQAEEDRDLVRRHFAQQKMEQDIFGKAQSVYNSDRYARVLEGLCWDLRHWD